MKTFKFLQRAVVLCVLVSFSACEEYLDAVPENEISEDVVFTNFQSVEKILGSTYYNVHNYLAGRDDWDGPVGVFSDEMHPVVNTSPTRENGHSGNWLDWNWREMGFNFNFNINNGGAQRRKQMTPGGLAVAGIRMANLALAQYEEDGPIRAIEDVPPALPGNLTREQILNYMEGEFKTLRAWFHFELIRRYGPLFILDEPTTPDVNFVAARAKYSEVTDWIAQELDSAVALLPRAWEGNFEGRATKASALAIKSMALLYAASPNMNEIDNGVVAYREEYLSRAVTASLEAIEEAKLSSNYRMYTWPEYLENWHSENDFVSDEGIWTPPQESWDNIGTGAIVGAGMFRPVAIPQAGGWNNHATPTQNIVDLFEFVDPNTNAALAIEDSPNYNPQDPYVNRDPRFYDFIWKNGDQYTINDPNIRVESHTGGTQHERANRNGTWTGYYNKKHNWLGLNNLDNVGKKRRMPHIRFAQLYLDFAEASNELNGPNFVVNHAGESMSAVDAINFVRRRVDGLPDVHPSYTGDKDTFRERIRNERAVELFSEMHRFQDLRRWRSLDVLDRIFKAEIERNDDGSFTYGKSEIDRARSYDERHYWYPLPLAEVQNNPNLTQSPGW